MKGFDMRAFKTDKIRDDWMTYDKTVAECQLMNHGCIYLDGYGLPIDDEERIEAMLILDGKKERR